MATFVTIFTTLLVAYISNDIYSFLRNALNARQSGFPSIYVPWNQQHIIWMLISPPLRGWLEQHLPAAIFDRLTLTIYGWEFFQRMKPFEEYCGAGTALKTFMLVTCGRLEIYTANAGVAAQILQRPADFRQLDIANRIMGVFGGNVITSDGHHWARQRKVVASVINERISKAVFDESIEQTQGLLEELSKKRQPNGTTETNQLFNMVNKIAINVLSAAGMGASVPWNDTTDNRPKPGFKQTYIQSVKKVIDSVAGPIILPLWFLRNYPSLLPGHKFMRDLGVAKQEFPIHTRDLLERERRRSKTEGSAAKSNVLSQLIQASEQPLDGDMGGVKGGSVTALSDEEMIGNLFLFTAAGFDTTANTISYALVLLARHPKWQDWLLEEIDAILPNSLDEHLDYSAVYPRATRIMAFMLETLRHFTPLIHISKQTRTPQTITTSTGSYWLPANTTVYINTIALHGDRTLWRGLNATPNDTLADEDEWSFRPSRWINPPGSSQLLFQPTKGAFVAWSTGPRVCPGQKMSQVEFTAVFLTLLRRHRVEAVVGKGETREDVERRLEGVMRDSMSLLTITMKGVYDVQEGDGKGLMLAVKRRR